MATTPTHRVSYRVFDPLLPRAEADAMSRLCERFGTYGMYSQEASEAEIGQGLFQRHDAVMNFMKTGGRFGRRADPSALGARTNYFRESYAYGDRIAIDGIEPFLRYEGFVEAARAIHGRPVIEPAIVYANILVAGQELAVHTDVPEFRGANRKIHPQWLLVVMHHSGLFDRWRMPIATGISWFQHAAGGALAYYPEGADGPARTHEARFNTALLMDTDSVFHGVDRVHETTAELPPFLPGMRLLSEGVGSGRWRVLDGDRVVASYRWEEIRFSISWKAYCFTDEEERRTWRDRRDDLSLDFILATLEEDLRRRSRLDGPRPDNRTFAELLVGEYIHFPPPTPLAA
jgi:hypothetical protein